METLLTKLDTFTSKWKTYQSSPSHKIRQRDYHRTTKAHVKAMHIFTIATIFSAQRTTHAYTKILILQWYTDSGLIGNRCPACMSYDPVDYVNNLHESKRTISVFGWKCQCNRNIGTLKWHLKDYQGEVHTF